MIDPHSSPFFGESLKLVSYCPYCENKHTSAEARILDENDGAKLVYIKCKKCHAGVVAVVCHSPFGMTSAGVITDLTSKDVLKFKDTESITDDDVLAVYETLCHEKDIAKLLA